MSGVRISRGHPVVALLAILGGWIGGRAVTWEAPASAALQMAAPAAANDAAVEEPGYRAAVYPGPQSLPAQMPAYGYGPVPHTRQVAYGMAGYPRYLYAMAPLMMPNWGRGAYGDGPGMAPYPPSRLAHVHGEFTPLPRFYAPEPPAMAGAPAARVAQGADPVAPARARRWSADAWALLRRDDAGAGASPGALPATYGASQAGAVLRYRLALGSPWQPTAYMRTTSTMGMLRETSAALGLSARPLRSFPVVAALEARLTDQGGQRRFQPAVMAVTELPPFSLPGGFRGEAYAQGGYVAGRFSTPFADGQFRADRQVLSVGRIETRVGGGVWGGIQKGAARLDAGPSASIAMPLGRGTNGRVAVDWRFRIVGDAVPDSGPAVTLSAGF